MFLLVEAVLPTIAHDEDAPDSAEGAGLGLLPLDVGTQTAEVGCIEMDWVRRGGAGAAIGETAGSTMLRLGR